MASIETSVLAHGKCNACNWYSPNTNENHREIGRDRVRESETRRRQRNNKYHGTIEMMKTDTMQFELILLMRLTRNNNIQTIRFIPRKTNQIEARRMREREGAKPNQKTNIKWRNKCDRFALARETVFGHNKHRIKQQKTEENEQYNTRPISLACYRVSWT